MTSLPLWDSVVPFNSSKSKYDDLIISKNPHFLVMYNWMRWVFDPSLKKDNHGHDDVLDRNMIKTGLCKKTYEDIPYLTPYIVPNSKIAVIIAPGGGFCSLITKAEGEYPAKLLNQNGISAFVLNYRLEPYRFPVPLIDMQRAVRYVRHNSAKLGLSFEKLGTMGFSAGGYTAAGHAILLGNKNVDAPNYTPDAIDSENSLPDFICQLYPLVSFEKNPGTLVNLKGPEVFSNPQKYNLWKKELSLLEHFQNAASIPQFMAYGTKDKLSDLPAYANLLKSASPKNKIQVLPNAPHGFSSQKKWRAWEEPCIQFIFDVLR